MNALYTLEDIKTLFKMSGVAELHVYIREHFVCAYDGELNFLGYRRI